MNIQISSAASSILKPNNLNAKPQAPATSPNTKAEATSQVQDSFTPNSEAKDKKGNSILNIAGISLTAGAAVGLPLLGGALAKSALATGGAIISSLALGPAAGAILGGTIGGLAFSSTLGSNSNQVQRIAFGAVGALIGGVAGGVAVPLLAALGAATGYIGAAVVAGATTAVTGAYLLQQRGKNN